MGEQAHRISSLRPKAVSLILRAFHKGFSVRVSLSGRVVRESVVKKVKCWVCKKNDPKMGVDLAMSEAYPENDCGSPMPGSPGGDAAGHGLLPMCPEQ